MSNTKTPTLDYSPLRRILSCAYEQAAYGKGAKRHANGRDFDKQPILEYGRIVGPGGTAFQAQKKLGEAISHHGSSPAGIAELHGAIVYAAATVLLMEEVCGATTPEHMLVEEEPSLFARPTTMAETAEALRQGLFKTNTPRSAHDPRNAVAAALGVTTDVPKGFISELSYNKIVDEYAALSDKYEKLVGTVVETKGMREALRAVIVLLSNNPHASIAPRLRAILSGYTLPDDLRTALDAIEGRVRAKAVNNTEPVEG